MGAEETLLGAEKNFCVQIGGHKPRPHLLYTVLRKVIFVINTAFSIVHFSEPFGMLLDGAHGIKS